MSSSVTCVKYWYQEHQTVGDSARSETPAAAAYPSAHRPRASSMEFAPVSTVRSTGPSADTATSPAPMSARIEGTGSALGGAENTTMPLPSPGSRPSRPSPQNASAG